MENYDNGPPQNPPGEVSGGPYSSNFQAHLDRLQVPRQRRSVLKKRPGDAWVEASKRQTTETDKEAEVAEALFDLANMFEKAETVLEGEEVGASSKRSLRARGKHSQAGGASHRAAAGQHNHDEAPQANGRGSGYGRYRRDAESTAARPSQAAAAEANGGAVPQQQQVPAGYDGNGGGLRNGEALPRDVANPWDPRHLQSLGLLPGGKANGLLGLSGFPPQLPAGLAGFYPPPSPATAAAQLAAWPSMAGSAAAAGQRAADGVASAQELLAADAAKRGADASRRFSRCATHVFIAHFISTQTKLDRQRQQAQQAQHAKQQAHQQHLTGGGGGGVGKFDLSSLYAARPGVQVALPSAIKLEPPAPGSVSAPLAGGGPLAGLNLSQLGAAGGLPGFPGSGGLANLANQSPLATAQGTQALTQQYARLQQQLALMAQQNGGGFPFLPPPSMGAANPFSGLNAQQLAAAAPFFSGAAHQFGLPGMLAPNLAHLTQPNGANGMRAPDVGSAADGPAKRPLSAPQQDDPAVGQQQQQQPAANGHHQPPPPSASADQHPPQQNPASGVPASAAAAAAAAAGLSAGPPQHPLSGTSPPGNSPVSAAAAAQQAMGFAGGNGGPLAAAFAAAVSASPAGASFGASGSLGLAPQQQQQLQQLTNGVQLTPAMLQAAAKAMAASGGLEHLNRMRSAGMLDGRNLAAPESHVARPEAAQ